MGCLFRLYRTILSVELYILYVYRYVYRESVRTYSFVAWWYCLSVHRIIVDSSNRSIGRACGVPVGLVVGCTLRSDLQTDRQNVCVAQIYVCCVRQYMMYVLTVGIHTLDITCGTINITCVQTDRMSQSTSSGQSRDVRIRLG